MFLLPPELAAHLRSAGWDLSALRRYLVSRLAPERRCAAEMIHPIVTGGAGVKMTYLPLWGGGTLPVTRALTSQA